MIDYNSHLESIFARWIVRSQYYGELCEQGSGQVVFTKDGLMEKNNSRINVAEEWHNAKRRIMFLVKDQPSEWCDDSRLWLKDIEGEKQENHQHKEANRNLKPRFIHNLANLFWGLWNATLDNLCSSEQLKSSFEQVKDCFNTHPFAYIECKKQGGKTSISNITLLHYLNKYGDLLREEIELLDPNMIVCTNPYIYAFVQQMYGGKFEQIEGHNSIRIDTMHHKLFSAPIILVHGT